MNTTRIRLPSPAMVVSCVALTVASTGVGYAATVLPKSSVGTAQLQKRAVTGAKLKPGAVSGAKVKDGSLTAADFVDGQLPAGPRGPKGDPGARGPAGAKGDAGVAGSAGLSGVEVVSATSTNNSPARWAIAYPTCPDDKRVISAGGSVSTTLADQGKVILTEAFALSNNAAKVAAEETAGSTPGTWTLTGYAICANVQ